MIDLIKYMSQLSSSDGYKILMFVVLLACAIKGAVSFYEWAYEKLKQIFNLEHTKVNEKQQLERKLNHGSQIMRDLQKNQQQTDEILESLTEKINMLVDSDRDDIKAFITREHHYFCYKVGWIDDFSLDCIQKRFKHYRDEGGNSFIEGFMEELRALPKQQPKEYR